MGAKASPRGPYVASNVAPPPRRWLENVTLSWAVWQDIAAERGVLRRVPEVQLTHRHFSNRLARFDDTYRKIRKVQDRALYHAWRNREDKT